MKARKNPPNTELRRFYERGDLPCVIDPRGIHNKLAWKVMCCVFVCVCVFIASQHTPTIQRMRQHYTTLTVCLHNLALVRKNYVS